MLDLHLKISPWPFINYANLEEKLKNKGTNIKIQLEPVKKQHVGKKQHAGTPSSIVHYGPQYIVHCVNP